MSYRDDLDAAHARIAALEAELAQHGGTPEDWQLERARVIEEVTQLRAIVEERRITIRDLRAKLTDLEREHGPALSLWTHNRRFPPLTGKPAGVNCPQCPDQPMLLDEPRITLLHATTVVCPRCLFVGRMRGG